MHALRSQIALTVVAFVLGLLVVAQLQSQQTAPALAGVSSQDLTVPVSYTHLTLPTTPYV